MSQREEGQHPEDDRAVPGPSARPSPRRLLPGVLRWARTLRTRLGRRARARSRTDGPSVSGVLRERYFPEGRGAPWHVRARAWAVYVVLTLLAGLAGFAGTYVYDLWSTEARLREQREAERALDGEGEPFTSDVTYDTTSFDSFSVVLDRPLTAEEGRTLQATPASEVWEFLRPLGGRMIPLPAGPGSAPTREGWTGGTGGHGTAVFTLNLMSARASQLSIVDMNPVNVSCADPTAVTVVHQPPSGAASYPGVVVDLNHHDPMLYISDEGPDQGEPFFNRRRIDLGGGLEPGGLRVEAQVTGRSCEWEIEARYLDARQNTGEVILRDDDRPFVVDVPPRRPAQYWLAGYAFPDAGGRTFVPCHETPEEFSCAPGLGIGEAD
ncbi:hypothetical protein [Nocardiopsis eucommiae]|uniref:hypothetical protein n=1 Tax=Nocardiopsis eucommiae TaxID=2831970 RepID=UPI003D719019